MIDSKNINCPLCNSIDYERIYKKEYKIWNKGKCFKWIAQQVICRECGMIFTNPQPTNKTLKWFYESDTRFGKHFRYFKDTQLDFIQKNTPKNCKTIFDIGAFEGIFLKIAKSRGYTVFGIEPSAEGVDRAMKEYKVKIIKGFFNKQFLNNFNSRFDIVTIRHVLEHVQNPVDFLKLAIKITNPCRYIYIEVPDASRPFPYNIADFFSEQHILHFSEGSLRNLANNLGISIVAIDKLQETPIIRILLKNIKIKKQPLENEYIINKRIIKNYKYQREKFIQYLESRIDPNIKKIIIYGAGMHTSQLFQSRLLDNIKIECIVDSNPKKHGMLFEGYKIQSPKILKEKNTPVLISSHGFQKNISNYLTVNFPNITQIKLYNNAIEY